MRKKKEKSLYDQIRKPMPRPGRVITPEKGRGTYNRKKEKKVYRSDELREKSRGFVFMICTACGS